MPWTHLACPESSPSFGEMHTPEHCITTCAHKCIAPPLLAGMMASSQRNHHRGKLISVSSLSSGGCARSLLLERTVDYAEHPQGGLYGYRGTVMHTVVEDAQSYEFPGGVSLQQLGFLQEHRMLMAFCFAHGGFQAPPEADPYDPNSWLGVVCPECKAKRVPLKDREWFFLSGTLDCAQPQWDAFDPDTGTLPVVIYDLKTMAEYAVDKLITGDAMKESAYETAVKDGYVEQLNLYAYLLQRGGIPEPIQRAARERGLEVERIVVTSLVIQAFSMNKFPLTGGRYRHRKHYKHDWSIWEVPPIPKFDDEWCENHVRKEGRKYYEAMILEKGRGQICPPEKNSAGAHNWKCGGFCPFHETELCPAPKLEWKFLQEGVEPEEAFQRALALSTLRGIHEEAVQSEYPDA